MTFRGGEFSTGTTGNFQSELTLYEFLLRAVKTEGLASTYFRVERLQRSDRTVPHRHYRSPACGRRLGPCLCKKTPRLANVCYLPHIWKQVGPEFMEAGKRHVRVDAEPETTRDDVQQLHQKNDRLKLPAADVSLENLTLKRSWY